MSPSNFDLSKPIQISVRRLSAECPTVRRPSDCRDSDCQDSVLLSEDSVTISVRTGNVGLDVGVGFVYSCRLCKQIWIGQDQTRVIIVILNSTKSVQSSQVRKVERLLTTVRVRLEIISFQFYSFLSAVGERSISSGEGAGGERSPYKGWRRSLLSLMLRSKRY